jgi:class III poly(R)-hydroxyalkanoic acid synthase PhaE subunit
MSLPGPIDDLGDETMSDEKATNGNTDWTEFQRKYWEAWSAFGRQALDAMTPQQSGANPWAQALDHWWNAVSGSTSPEIESFYSKLIEQGKTFFRLSEGMTRGFQSAATSGHEFMDLQHETEKALAGMKEAFTGSGTQAHDLMRQVMAFWELPLDTWQRTASSLSLLPGDFLQNLKLEDVERVSETIDDRIDRFLSVPGVGYTREWQEQLQQHARLWLDYQRAHQRYVAGFSKLGLQSVERFENKLKELSAAGKKVGAARELYDLWVDCCEEVYGEYASTDEYAELHAELVNTLMQVKRHAGALIDEYLGAMNMPTRREVNTLHRRVQETRREGKAFAAELETLKEQVGRMLNGQQIGAAVSTQQSGTTRTRSQPVRTRKVKTPTPTSREGATKGG